MTINRYLCNNLDKCMADGRADLFKLQEFDEHQQRSKMYMYRLIALSEGTIYAQR